MLTNDNKMIEFFFEIQAMLTLSNLSDDLIGLIFEKCEDLCAIFLALCSKQFYNLALALRIDLRYRSSYIVKHDKIALWMITHVCDEKIQTGFCGIGSKAIVCSCRIDNLCRKCAWVAIIDRWCKEKNIEMLEKIDISILPFDLLFKFPADLLVRYGWETLDKYSEVVLRSRMGVIRNYLVVCFRLHGTEYTKSIITKHKLWKFAGFIDDELANLVVENYVGFNLHTFKQCTLINKQAYLKNFANYMPEWEWAFRDIADVEEHLHIGSITEKIASFIHFNRIDCILLCLHQQVELTVELKRFLTKTTDEEILKINVDARLMISACIFECEYENYPRWRSQCEEIELYENEKFYIHHRMWQPCMPVELIIMACQDCPANVYISENYDAIMALVKDINSAAYQMTSRHMLKCLKRLVKQFGLTKEMFEKIILAFLPGPNRKFSHAFIDYIHELIIQNDDRSKLTFVLGNAIISHYVEMVELLLPIAEFKDYMAKVIIKNDDRILLRKCRRFIREC